MEELDKLLGGEIQQLVEVHSAEGELPECTALGLCFLVGLKGPQYRFI
jgi:hypothetical protein